MLKVYLTVVLSLFFLGECYPQEQNTLIKNPDYGILEKDDAYLKDFGQIKEGEIAGHSFIIKNDADKILNIKDVSTSCGCTVSEIQSRVLKPKESTTLEVKFNTKGYSGKVQQFVYVSTDSLDMPTIRFIIKANIVK